MSSPGPVPGDIASLAGTLAGFLLAAGPAHVVERVQLVGAGLVAVEVAYQTADRGRLAAGPAWSDSGHVFTTEVGEPLRPATVSLAFERAVGRAKLPAIRLQDLRHVSATLALLAGVPVHVVSARLGHADPAITLRVYSHCLPTSQRDARPESALRSTAPGWCCLPKVCHRATKPDIRREGRSATAQRLQGIRRSGPLRMHLTSGQSSQLNP